MSAFKKLTTNDVLFYEHNAQKKFINSFPSNSLGYTVKDGVVNSGSIYPSEFLFSLKENYRSIEHLYFKGPIELQTTSSFESYFDSGYSSGSRNISNVFRSFSIPSKTFGTHIVPGSFKIKDIQTGELYIENEPDYVLETIEIGGEYIQQA